MLCWKDYGVCEYMHSKYYKNFAVLYREILKNTNKINVKLLLSQENFCRMYDVAKILQINCCPIKVMVWGIKKLQNSYFLKRFME